MRAFREALAAAQPPLGDRSWVYVPYDQLTDAVGPLAERPPGELAVVLVESLAKAGRRPYHRQKLATVLTNQRHFALEQARRGVFVDYRASPLGYAEVLDAVFAERGPLVCMRPAERELRAELAPLVRDGRLSWVEHAGWLSTPVDFAQVRLPYRMDAFYRHVRRRTGLLMHEGAPLGGQFSHDGANRERWEGEPAAPELPRFRVDAITEEVGALLTSGPLREHPGTLDLGAIPATRDDAERAWSWALERCLPSFGPYEDAMSTRSHSLFHTRISPLLNLHRLLPARVVADVAAANLPLNSQEGFIRQVLGWREFVRHVHEVTDGFRVLPGDAAFTGRHFPIPTSGPDDGAVPRFLDGDMDLPPAFWSGTPSGLRCLDQVVEEVWDYGHSHHITRLMVLSNLARLLDVSPRQLTDWFWVAYDDAYDWVVEPNVLGMGTFAVGDLMTTKPYVSGANYIHSMSDYCRSCAFHPKKTCPITPMYWSFLDRNRDALSTVQRMTLPLKGLERRATAQRAKDRATYDRVRRALLAGERLSPDADSLDPD